MSKSKKNVVDPERIIDTYGADTARLFMLSDSPPDRDLDWTDAGIEGAWRYVGRLHRLAAANLQRLATKGAPKPDGIEGAALDVHRQTHKTIAAVTKDLDAFHFNKAVARIRELTNALEELKGEDAATAWVLREGLEAAIKLIGPMMPHLSEELWHVLGHDGLLADQPWPEAEAALLVDDTVTVAVQVMGKMRGTVELPKDCAQADAEAAALALDTVLAAMGGKTPKKIILVPNRIVNVVL